jgi:hypothetical protein
MGVAGSDDEWNGLFGSPRSKPFPVSMIWPSYSDTWIAARINGKSFEGPNAASAVLRRPEIPSFTTGDHHAQEIQFAFRCARSVRSMTALGMSPRQRRPERRSGSNAW